MTAVCTTPAAVPAVEIEEAREKVRASADDGLDDQLELSLRGLIEETEHETGHCFMESGWLVTLNAFPAWRDGVPFCDEPIIRLPHPARAVQSVTYIGAAGAEQVLPPTEYDLVVERYRSYLAPKAMSWPATADRRRAVRIECTAGHGTTPDKTPAVARQYILARLELEYCPPMHPPTVDQLKCMLSSLTVYG